MFAEEVFGEILLKNVIFTDFFEIFQ